jgi:hypothetical protein
MAVRGGVVSVLASFACVAAACSRDVPEHAKKINASSLELVAKTVPDCLAVVAVSKFRSTLKGKPDMGTFLFPDAEAVWKENEIPVCWEKMAADPFEQSRREQARKAVERTWEAASQVRFTGWAKCPQDDFAGVRIEIADRKKGSLTVALGEKLKGIPGGMVLNFTMKNWQPKCGNTDACFEQIVVHEFGHALAFAHEQNRPDEPGQECRKTAQGDSGTCTLCAPDRSSIMSYCRSDWSNNGKLSSCDQSGVAALYGAP